MTRTSFMVVATRPTRFGFTPVDVFFGEVRERPDRVMVVAGDLLRNDATGEVVTFKGREGSTLVTEPVEEGGS